MSNRARSTGSSTSSSGSGNGSGEPFSSASWKARRRVERIQSRKRGLAPPPVRLRADTWRVLIPASPADALILDEETTPTLAHSLLGAPRSATHEATPDGAPGGADDSASDSRVSKAVEARSAARAAEASQLVDDFADILTGTGDIEMATDPAVAAGDTVPWVDACEPVGRAVDAIRVYDAIQGPRRLLRNGRVIADSVRDADGDGGQPALF